MLLVRMLLVSSLMFALSSCATTKDSGRGTLGLLEYGDYQPKVLTSIEKSIPLFKFYSENKEYFAVSVEPKNTYQGYVLLFEDEQLSSIIPVEKGIQIWEEAYDSYKRTVPTVDKFDYIVSRLAEEQLDISTTNFLKVNEKSINDKEVTQAIATNIFMPLGLVAFIVTAPILVPYTVNAMNQAELEEQLFLEKLNSVKLKSSMNMVETQLGKARSKYTNEGESILLFDEKTKDDNYNPLCNVSMGFVQDELKWIGYYFHAGKRLEKYSSN